VETYFLELGVLPFNRSQCRTTGLTAQNPLVTFGSTGSYTVTLTAANTAGSNTITKINFVAVT
jgi:PKD repeat protein